MTTNTLAIVDDEAVIHKFLLPYMVIRMRLLRQPSWLINVAFNYQNVKNAPF
jgi:hypothetical protein